MQVIDITEDVRYRKMEVLGERRLVVSGDG